MFKRIILLALFIGLVGTSNAGAYCNRDAEFAYVYYGCKQEPVRKKFQEKSEPQNVCQIEGGVEARQFLFITEVFAFPEARRQELREQLYAAFAERTGLAGSNLRMICKKKREWAENSRAKSLKIWNQPPVELVPIEAPGE